MHYESTRSTLSGTDTYAVLQGLAPDGGLFLDKTLGSRPFPVQECLKKDSLGMAEMILSYLMPGFENMKALVEKAYTGKFETEDLTPLVKVGNDYVLELFRGPTSAFKDVALSMLPQLMTAARRQEGMAGKTVILTATSGDTGKAALNGFMDVEGTSIIVFYPAEGVSPMQQRQMATQEGKNVTVCSVEGNFDDCQRGVKEAFAALSEKLEGTGVSLSSANSINIGRLAPQVTYYFIAYARLMEEGRIAFGDKVDYIVPTGNFGDILAGYYAKMMGLPVGRLVCASNANKVLTDFLETGLYDRRREFYKTASPSMDILVSSNLERLLYYASQSHEKVKGWMEQLNREGFYQVDEATLKAIQENFSAGCCNEEETMAAIGKVWQEEKYLLDPHTAVAWHVMEQVKAQAEGRPQVVLSTASPYKFPAPVLKALGLTGGQDEFADAEKLNQVTGVPVPGNLSSLRQKPILHKDRIAREEIIPYILSKVAE
ncbi:MAG: threonine synthase [Clostridia bacterium]|nr:threonine synthase [Clostridia bacterium]